jgi:thiol-disulfide isomerase/thioredoxin
MSEPTEKSNRIWLYVAIGFVVFWGLTLTFFAPKIASRGPLLTNPGSSGSADYSWRLLDLDGQPVMFEKFKGKTVFLNIWATWCGPCVQELPSIARLAAEPSLKDVAFVCVSTDESAQTVKRFLQGKNWPMTVLRATDCPSVFATDGIPATFLIGPDGTIAASEVGSADWDDPKVVALLSGLAAKK